jgi:hypothetical protein
MLGAIRRGAALAPVLVVLAATAAPSCAVGVAAGELSGTVNLSPGFATPPAVLANQTFTFSSVVMTGVAASTQCAGVVSAVANASGGSIVESFAGGVGTLSINAAGTCTIGQLSLACNGGVYLRAGVLVAAASLCTTGGQAAVSVVVVPAALFLPNQTPPATITSATLAGAWTLTTV